MVVDLFSIYIQIINKIDFNFLKSEWWSFNHQQKKKKKKKKKNQWCLFMIFEEVADEFGVFCSKIVGATDNLRSSINVQKKEKEEETKQSNNNNNNNNNNNIQQQKQ